MREAKGYTSILEPAPEELTGKQANLYRRIQAGCGGPRAVVVTAHKIAARVYRLLKYGEAYVRKEMADYEANYRKQVLKGLTRRAKEMGYRLEPADSSP